MSKARYKQAEIIQSITQFEYCDTDWFKWRGQTKHRAFLESWPYRLLRDSIMSGYLYAARTEDNLYSNSNATTKCLDSEWDLDTCPLCGGKMWWFGGNYACRDCHHIEIGSHPIELDKPRRSENEEMQEVANRDAFYGEALND